MADYKIELGVGLDKAQLNQVKNILENIENQKREVIYNVDFNIKNVEKLTTVGKEIDKIKDQLKGLRATDKSKTAIPIDAQKVEASLTKIHESIKKLQNAFGRVDKNKGVQSLLTTVNKIRAALEGVSSQFGELNKNLNALSGKDFNLNFDFGFGGSSKKNPDQILSEFKMLKKEAEEYEKYFGKMYSSAKSGTDSNKNSIFNLVSQYDRKNLSYLIGLSNTINTGSEPSQKKNAALKEYIRLIKEAATIGNISLEPIELRLAESGDFVKTKNEISETEQKLKELFSGGIDATKLHQTLDDISLDLKEIQKSLSELSQGISVKGIAEQFQTLSDSIELLIKNCTTAKQSLDNIGNVGTSTNQVSGVDNLEQNLEQVTTAAKNASDAIQQTSNEAKKLNNISINISDGNIDDIKNALRNMNIDDSDIDEATKELNELNIAAKNVSATFKDGQLVKVDVKGVETAVNGVKQAVSVTTTFGEKGAASSKKYSQALDEVAIAAEKVNKKLKSGTDGNTKFDVEISSVEKDFNNLSDKSAKLQNKIKLLKKAFEDVQTASAKGGIKELVAANERYERVLQDVNNQLKINKQIEQQQNNADKLVTAKQNALLRLKNLFGDDSEAARKFASEIDRIQREINECGNLDGISDLNRQITNLGRRAEYAGVQTQTFGQRFKKQWEQYKSYLSVASLFMYAEQGLRSMFEQVKLIDSAMTELKKVTNETDAAYDKFLSNAASRAKEIGTTIDGLVSSTADFARLGYGFKDSQKLAEVANIYAVVGDEIDGVETATKSLISTMTAFGIESSNSMSIVDKFNEIGNNFAISSGGIGEALERSASSMAAANNSIDETIALITAANTVVQDPDAVGTAFKTKFF